MDEEQKKHPGHSEMPKTDRPEVPPPPDLVPEPSGDKSTSPDVQQGGRDTEETGRWDNKTR